MRRSLRRLTKRALAGALAFVLAAAAGTAGWSFVWCAPMSEARLHCCCPSKPSSHDVVARACCEERSVPAVPRIDADLSFPDLGPAALLAIVPLWAWFGVHEHEGAARRDHASFARAGPDQRLHATHSVFLI